MNYLIYILLIIGFFWLATKWLDYLKATRGTDGYAKRRIFSLLFMAFMALIGITTVFADALFEFLGLDKPAQFEWISLGAFAVLAYAGIRIAESGQKGGANEPTGGTTITQNHSGRGDNVGGDKVTVSGSKNVNTGSIEAGGNVHIGNTKKKIITHIHPNKKKASKELTPIQLTNPDNIIGREEDIEELHTSLFNHKKVVVVNGIGGIGKTTIAEAYIFKYYEEYQYIVWITQDVNNKLEDDFALNSDLIKNLHIEVADMEPQDAFREILRALRNLKKGPNLLVLDNADSSIAKQLHLLPGQPNWHLLFTSREVIKEMHLKELGFLNHQEAIALFRKHCQLITNENQIGELVKILDYHTLTIEILAKTAQRRQVDIQQLKLALESDLKTKVQTRHSKLEKTDSITTYLCSIFDLSQLDKEEQWLMKQFACIPPILHSFQSLKSLFSPENSKEDFAYTLSELHEKGWLMYHSDTNSYKMHRIIAEVTAQKIKISIDNVSPLLEQITGLLSIDQTRDNPVEKFQWIPFGRAILNQFPASGLAVIAELQNNLALVLQDLGDYESAKILLEKATISAEKNFGPKHSNTAISYSNLAIVLTALSDYEGARVLLKKAIISDEKNFGTEHPNTAIRYSNLGLVLKEIGDYTGAKILLEKAKNSAENNFGTEHSTTMISYSNLAVVLQNLGDYEGAKILLEKAKKLAEQILGTEHPITVTSYSNLALVLKDLNDYEGAKILLEKVITSDEKNFGPDHQNMSISYSNLAIVLHSLGDYKKAKVLLERSIISGEKNLGAKHPQIAVSYFNLALVLKDLGDSKGALSLLYKTLEIYKKTLPAGHPHIVQVKQRIQAIEKK